MNNLITLDNGLKIFLVNDNTKHTTYINLIVKYGGLDNTFYINNKKYVMKDGMAHFIEHLVLESSCYGDLMDNFGRLGIISNGLTGLEKTQFYIDTVDHIYDGLKVLIKGIHKPIINKNVIENIKKPILEEKRRSLDNKYSVLYNEAFSNIIDTKSFKSVLGEINELENISINDIITCFNAFYRPSNEIIVIGGRFDKDKVIDIIKKTYDELEFNNDIVTKKLKHKNTVNKKNSIIKTNTGINRVLISFKLNTINLSSFDKLKVDTYLACFLKQNFGILSLLNKELVNNNIVTNGITYSNDVVEGYHYIMLEANTNKETIFIDKILNYFKEKKYTFDEELFNLFIRSCIINFISRKDNIYNTIDPYIDNIVKFNYELLDDIKDLESLNFKEYKSIIENIDFSNYTITKLNQK